MRDEPVECEPLPPIVIAVLRRSRAFQLWASIWAMTTSKRPHLSHLFRLLSFAGVPRKRSYIIWMFDAHRNELAIGHGSEPNFHRIMPMRVPSLGELRQYEVNLNLKMINTRRWKSIKIGESHDLQKNLGPTFSTLSLVSRNSTLSFSREIARESTLIACDEGG